MQAFSLRPPILILVALISLPALANDGAAGFENGVLVPKQGGPVRIVSEKLLVSVDAIEVDYVFENPSDAAFETVVAFPTPEYELDPCSDTVEVEDFRVWVDGKAIKTEVETRLDGKVVAPGTKPPELSDENDCSDTHQKQVTYFWTQRFPAKGRLAVRHRYKPSVAHATGLNVKSVETRYCTQDTFKGRKFKAIDIDGKQLVEVYNRRLSYILVNARTWNGPIGQFELTIRKPAKSAAISTCFHGELKKVSETDFRFTASNYAVKEDLHLLFLDDAAKTLKR